MWSSSRSASIDRGAEVRLKLGTIINIDLPLAYRFTLSALMIFRWLLGLLHSCYR